MQNSGCTVIALKKAANGIVGENKDTEHSGIRKKMRNKIRYRTHTYYRESSAVVKSYVDPFGTALKFAAKQQQHK